MKTLRNPLLEPVDIDAGKEYTSDDVYLFEKIKSKCLDSGINRSLTVNPQHLTHGDVLEIQQALDDLLLRFIASYRKCPDIPELEPAKSGLLYRGALSMTSIVFAHEDTFRVSQVPEDPPAKVEPYRHRFKEGARIVSCGEPRLTQTQSHDLNEIIQRYIRAGLVYENHRSVWSSRINMQPKPNSKPPWRITIDLKEVNNQLLPTQWPLPRLDELAMYTRGHTYFGDTDAQGGYWQMLLHPDSQELYSFHPDAYPTRLC